MLFFLRMMLVCFVFCSGFSATANSIDYEYLDARLKKLSDRDDVMGLAVAVVENGNIRFSKGYGYTAEGGQPVDTQTRFRWASVSKGLSGTLAAQLEHEGKLQLEAPIGPLSPTLKLPGSGEFKATVEDLLSHRVGLVSNAYDNKIEGGRDPALVRQTLSELKLVCPIGDCHAYQNVAFDAIEEVFKTTTGAEFSSLLNTKVFQPLGMTSASVSYSEFKNSYNHAHPYNWSSGRKALIPTSTTRAYFRVAAAGGVSSSITDMAKYLQAQMGLRPHVFHPDALRKAHKPVVATVRHERGLKRKYDGVSSAQYGLGWRVYEYQGRTLVGHQGMVRGTRALILFDPELKTGVVATWNSNVTRPTGLQFEVMDMVYGLPKRDWMRLLEPKT